MVPDQVKIVGALAIDNDQCSRVSLGFWSFDTQNKIASTAEIELRPNDPREFAVSLQNRDTAYLLFNISSNQENEPIDCSLKIGYLSVSKG